MNERLIIEEQYKKGDEIINYVVYKSKTGAGNDEVLQHKIMGTETAHITLHPDGTVNFRIEKEKIYLENAIKNNLLWFKPNLSKDVKLFISKVRSKI